MAKQHQYVELNLFPEEEAEQHQDSHSNKEHESSSCKAYDFTALFDRLSKSDFRSRFHLTTKDKEYIAEKGLATIRKQTPMRGHPVFIAQHATGCCCRGCFSKWHHIPAGRPLTTAEQQYAVAVLMAWIEQQI